MTIGDDLQHAAIIQTLVPEAERTINDKVILRLAAEVKRLQELAAESNGPAKAYYRRSWEAAEERFETLRVAVQEAVDTQFPFAVLDRLRKVLRQVTP